MKTFQLISDEDKFTEEVQRIIFGVISSKPQGEENALFDNAKEHELSDNIARTVNQKDAVGLLSLLKTHLKALENDECYLISPNEPAIALITFCSKSNQ